MAKTGIRQMSIAEEQEIVDVVQEVVDAEYEFLEANNSTHMEFWIVVTEDAPEDFIAGVFPKPLTRRRAEDLAERYRRRGFPTAEAKRIILDARNAIDSAKSTVAMAISELRRMTEEAD